MPCQIQCNCCIITGNTRILPTMVNILQQGDRYAIHCLIHCRRKVCAVGDHTSLCHLHDHLRIASLAGIDAIVFGYLRRFVWAGITADGTSAICKGFVRTGKAAITFVFALCFAAMFMCHDCHAFGGCIGDVCLCNIFILICSRDFHLILICALYKGSACRQIICQGFALWHFQTSQQCCALTEGQAAALQVNGVVYLVGTSLAAPNRNILSYNQAAAIDHNTCARIRGGAVLIKVPVFQCYLASGDCQWNPGILIIRKISTP